MYTFDIDRITKVSLLIYQLNISYSKTSSDQLQQWCLHMPSYFPQSYSFSSLMFWSSFCHTLISISFPQGMCMGFAHTIITSSVYSTNTIMKTVLQEAIPEMVGDAEGWGGILISYHGVKGEMKWLKANRMAGSVSSMSVVIEPMTYWLLG